MKNLEDMLLNKTQSTWARRLGDLLADFPAGVELVVRPGRADVVHAGFKERVLDKSDPHKVAALIEKETRMVIALGTHVVPISD